MVEACPGNAADWHYQSRRNSQIKSLAEFSLQQQTFTGLQEKTTADTLPGSNDPTSSDFLSQTEMRILIVRSLHSVSLTLEECFLVLVWVWDTWALIRNNKHKERTFPVRTPDQVLRQGPDLCQLLHHFHGTSWGPMLLTIIHSKL